MPDIFGRNLTIPGNIEDASDATLLRVARQAGENTAEISQIERELKALRREAKQAKAAARRATGANATVVGGATKVGSMRGTRIRGEKRGLSAGGISLRGGRVAVETGAMNAMRMGSAAYVVMGSVSVVGGAIKQWRELSDVRERYGAGEALGRIGRGALRNVFESGAQPLAEGISEIVGASGGDGAAYLQRLKALANSIFETDAEEIERGIQEAATKRRALAVGAAYYDEEMAAIKRYKPKNVAFRTSRDIGMVRRKIIQRDADTIAADSLAAEQDILRRAGLLAED